jgi:hypothetical protein
MWPFDSGLARPYNPSLALLRSVRLRPRLLTFVIPLVLVIACGVDQPDMVGVSPPTASSPTPSVTATRSVPTATLSPTTGVGNELTPAPPPSSFRDVVLSEGVTEDSRPLGSMEVFSPETEVVYAFFDFVDMRPEMEWAHVWYYETEELGRETQPWRWGTAGRAYIYRGFDDGMRPGEYELMFYADGVLQTVVTFSVR